MVDQYRKAKFYVFTGNRDVDGTVYQEKRTCQWIRWNEQTQVWYADTGLNRKNLKKQIRQIKPDILFIVGLYSFDYNIYPTFSIKTPKTIISVRGMLHTQALRQKQLKKQLYLKFLRFMARKARFTFHATTKYEQQFVLKNLKIPLEKIFIAGNFPTFFDRQPLPEKFVGELRMVSIALISPMKNLLLVLKSLSGIQGKVIYDIYGAVNDRAYWKDCLNVIENLPVNISVSWKGPISPLKVKMVLTDYHLFILPSKSENFGHAIFEALSSGRPVLTSHGTPFNGLEESKCGLNIEPDNCEELLDAIQFTVDWDDAGLQARSGNAVRYALDFLMRMELEKSYDLMFEV